MDLYKNYYLLLTATLTNCYKCCVKKKKNCKIEMPYVIPLYLLKNSDIKSIINLLYKC